jgi:hypothetical protein
MSLAMLHFNEYITHIETSAGAKQEANMANGELRGERLQIMLTGEELTVLDDFRYRRRMPSRAAAVRELLKRGLAAEGFQAAAFGTKSEDFGVIGQTPKGREAK